MRHLGHGACSSGFVVGVIGGFGIAGFSVWSVLAATLGAVLSLCVYGWITSRTI